MNDLFSVTVGVSNGQVTIYCAVADCVESASCTVTYNDIDGDGSSLMTDSGMTSDCGDSMSRNITVQLQGLPSNKRYSYNVTVTIDGTDLLVTAQGTFHIGKYLHHIFTASFHFAIVTCGSCQSERMNKLHTVKTKVETNQCIHVCLVT